MDVYERRRTRLRELLKEITQADLARRSDIAPSTISRYLKQPGSKGFKNMSEENARKIEGAAKKPEHWLDKQHAYGGAESRGSTVLVAHDVSHREHSHPLLELTWELLMLKVPDSLFSLALRDDALAPAFPKGTVVVWRKNRQLRTERLVLLRDMQGEIYARVLHQTSLPGQWTAAASSSAYLSFRVPSEEVTVLAVHQGFLERDDF